MSAKGQVVIPKDFRDRHRFAAGEALEVVSQPNGVLLRKRASKSSASFDEITARIRARVTYGGPPVSIESLNWSIAEMWTTSGSDRTDPHQ